MAAVRAHIPRADHPATRLGPKRSASDPPSVGPNTLGANLARMYRAGASGRCVRVNSRTPSATTVTQSPYVEIPAATSRRADRSALGSVPAACGKKRAASIAMSTPGSGGGKQSATPQEETHGVAPNGFKNPERPRGTRVGESAPGYAVRHLRLHGYRRRQGPRPTG